MTPFSSEALRSHIKSVPDFPKPGVLYRDISPLLANPQLLQMVVQEFAHRFGDARPDAILGLESRGFIFGAPLAMHLNCAFVPARKPGKLPRKTIQVEYELEYGTDSLEVHADALVDRKVWVVDDLLATGGTAMAAEKLIEKSLGEHLGTAVVIELLGLGGREQLSGNLISLLQYD